ncbi:MAG TPA: hypothetical protein VNT27_06200 [Propionibacteriaceae bacterium]|nr:hypothetical protein [Propionibacteriaceae bacterium]
MADDLPCVIATPLVNGHPAYLRWIIDETTLADARQSTVRIHEHNRARAVGLGQPGRNTQ